MSDSALRASGNKSPKVYLPPHLFLSFVPGAGSYSRIVGAFYCYASPKFGSEFIQPLPRPRDT